MIPKVSVYPSAAAPSSWSARRRSGLGRGGAPVCSRLIPGAGGARDKGQFPQSLTELLLAAHRATQLQFCGLIDTFHPEAVSRSMKGAGLRFASRSAKWAAIIVHARFSVGREMRQYLSFAAVAFLARMPP